MSPSEGDYEGGFKPIPRETDRIKMEDEDRGQNNAFLENRGERDERKEADRSSKKVRVRTLRGKEIVARKMQVGSFSIVCRTEPLGMENSAVMWESGLILINRDHPLYKRFSKKQEALTLFITKLIAQEIATLRASSPKDAFSLQNQILTDAWG